MTRCTECDCGHCRTVRGALVVWRAIVSTGLIAVVAERLLR